MPDTLKGNPPNWYTDALDTTIVVHHESGDIICEMTPAAAEDLARSLLARARECRERAAEKGSWLSRYARAMAWIDHYCDTQVDNEHILPNLIADIESGEWPKKTGA